MPEAADERSTSDARHWWVIAGIGVVVCALAAGGIAVVATRVRPSPAGAAAPKPPTPLAVASSSPAPGAGAVAGDASLSVTFTVALAPDTPVPTLSPAVPGSWVQTSPTTLAFDAQGPLPPGATLSMTVPGGAGGVKGTQGQVLAQPLTTQFTVAPMGMLRVQQLLAELGYLPLSFTATGPAPTPDEAASPEVGSFAWRYAMPAALTSLWSPGVGNVVTRGAIMAFESQEHLTTDGIAGPKVWTALLSASAAGQDDSDPNYDWVDVSESLPEHVDVWRNGQVVYSTLANTGIGAAPTAQGTFPVYARYLTTTMTGHNPDGSRYSDPGVPWVSYFNGGDALHGFIRGGYGWPQSLGCVEMPPSHAEVVYPYTPIGTLVTVQ